MKYGHASVILALSVLGCHSIIILDRGNPARFIRGAFLDVNQAELSGVSESESQSNTFSMTQQQMHVMAGNLMEAIAGNLAEYNKAITDSMIIEAKDITPLASVNMCRFARMRMSALRIINAFQSLRVQSANFGMDVDGVSSSVSSNILTEKLRAGIADVATDFVLMEQDLQQFDQIKLGESPMMHFGQAMKDFTVLQITLSGLRGVFENSENET